ncbi:MAG: hypothetical protein RDV48_07520 [Candidatus Eremiobacteraeota bacterium]|nr:hypothetical protein [Candidatus Eremiobacteraeota bacterium]
MIVGVEKEIVHKRRIREGLSKKGCDYMPGGGMGGMRGPGGGGGGGFGILSFLEVILTLVQIGAYGFGTYIFWRALLAFEKYVEKLTK